MDNPTILVADADASVADCIAEALASQGYTVQCYVNDQLTIDVIEQAHPDLLILEQQLARPDLNHLLEQLHHQSIARSVAVIISSTDLEGLSKLTAAVRAQGCAALPKPFYLDQLFHCVARALQKV